ncbi:MAG: hypothetical protein ACI9TY_000340 [Alphaproteobacteria bacterium]|jgi:hypothetical protein
MSEKRYQSSSKQRQNSLEDIELDESGLKGLQGNQNFTQEEALNAVDNEQSRGYSAEEVSEARAKEQQRKEETHNVLEFTGGEELENPLAAALAKAKEKDEGPEL